MPTLTRLLFVVVLVSAFSVTGAAAQEVETEIRFEDEVVEREETTITYVSTVVETPVETDVNTEVTLMVDGEEVDSLSTEEEVFEGAEIRTEFTHTFESAGEKEVTVEAVASVSRFAPEATDSTTATVTVMSAEDEGTDGGTDGEVNDTTDEDEEVEATENDKGATENEADETETGKGTEAKEGDGEAGDDDESDDGEGLPGFGFSTALLCLSVVTAVLVRSKAQE